MFRHLHASREIIVEIQNRQSTELLGSDAANEFGLSLELYTYIIITNCLTPYGILQERIFPLDPFITSPNCLAVYSTFGTMFAGLHDLFALIPQISLLFGCRLMEQESGTFGPTAAYVELHEKLQSRLRGWNCSHRDLVSPSSTVSQGDQGRVTKILQIGIEIYLVAAMEGSSLLNPKIVCQFQSYVDVIYGLGFDLDNSQWAAILLWPIIMAGSCVIQKQQQETLYKALVQSRYRMNHNLRASELLQRLWDNQDPLVYGPYGVYLMISKYNATFTIL